MPHTKGNGEKRENFSVLETNTKAVPLDLILIFFDSAKLNDLLRKLRLASPPQPASTSP